MSSEVAAEDTARLGVPGSASASTSGGRDGERVGGNASERAGTRRRGGTRDGASGRERERQRGREKDRDVGRERDRKKEREEAVVRERPGPKRLVIRRLPPGLTQAAFHEAMASCPCQLGSVRFVPGLEGKGYMGDSRAYVTLAAHGGDAPTASSSASSLLSAQKFKQWVEGSENARVFGNVVMVGFAAYAAPGVGGIATERRDDSGELKGGQLVNDLAGTLEESDMFKEFIERIEREKRELEEGGKPVAERFEVSGEVRRTTLMEFVERKFRKKGRGKKKGGKQTGSEQGKNGGGQGVPGRGKGQQEKGDGGQGGQKKKKKNKNRKGDGPRGAREGAVHGAASKDPAPTERKGPSQPRRNKNKNKKPPADSNDAIRIAENVDSKSMGVAKGKAKRRGRQQEGKAGVSTGGSTDGGAARKGRQSKPPVKILNPNAASFT